LRRTSATDLDTSRRTIMRQLVAPSIFLAVI